VSALRIVFYVEFSLIVIWCLGRGDLALAEEKILIRFRNFDGF